MTSVNPFQDATEKVQRTNNQFALGVARVVRVPDDSRHEITIQVVTDGIGGGESGPDVAPVLTAQRGDIALPSEGDFVIFGLLANQRPIVLGTVYTEGDDVRSYGSQERHIGADDGSGVFLHGPFGVVPKLSDAPSDPPDGSVWYRTDVNEYRGMKNGTKVSFDTTTV